jgi:hypothetical protein
MNRVFEPGESLCITVAANAEQEKHNVELYR